jgi:hypothetical protein
MMRNSHLIGAWLSLFAMLMIFAGPLNSQGISLTRDKSQPMRMAGMSQMLHHASANNPHDLIV